MSGHILLIADRDQFVAASGSNTKNIVGKNISKKLEEKMNSRETINASRYDKNFITVLENEPEEYQSEVIIPIITQGDVLGAVILLSTRADDNMSEVELKLAQSAADFLGKQMEN